MCVIFLFILILVFFFIEIAFFHTVTITMVDININTIHMQLCLWMYYHKSIHSFIEFHTIELSKIICMVLKNWPIFFLHFFPSYTLPFSFFFLELKSECSSCKNVPCVPFFHFVLFFSLHNKYPVTISFHSISIAY